MDQQPESSGHSQQKPARRRYDRYVTRTASLTERGYACVALDRPNDEVNVGHTMRAALCFQARMVIIGGAMSDLNVKRLKTDPGRAYRHVPVIQVEDLFEALPEECTPVAVELTEDAVDLANFVHPERACYIFGPENGSVSEDVLQRCAIKVKISTSVSLNLGMAVNIVLYDRAAKSSRQSAALTD